MKYRCYKCDICGKEMRGAKSENKISWKKNQWNGWDGYTTHKIDMCDVCAKAFCEWYRHNTERGGE